jgi:hypothetical protein
MGGVLEGNGGRRSGRIGFEGKDEPTPIGEVLCPVVEKTDDPQIQKEYEASRGEKKTDR